VRKLPTCSETWESVKEAFYSPMMAISVLLSIVSVTFETNDGNKRNLVSRIIAVSVKVSRMIAVSVSRMIEVYGTTSRMIAVSVTVTR